MQELTIVKPIKQITAPGASVRVLLFILPIWSSSIVRKLSFSARRLFFVVRRFKIIFAGPARVSKVFFEGMVSGGLDSSHRN
jgi:hypothetical protein